MVERGLDRLVDEPVRGIEGGGGALRDIGDARAPELAALPRRSPSSRSMPSKTIEPPLMRQPGLAKPMAARPMVDLPAPDSPIRPSTSPRFRVRSTPLTIWCHLSSLKPSICEALDLEKDVALGPRLCGSVLIAAARSSRCRNQSTTKLTATVSSAMAPAGSSGVDVAIGDQRLVLAHHRAPVGGRRLDADAEEGQRR